MRSRSTSLLCLRIFRPVRLSAKCKQTPRSKNVGRDCLVRLSPRLCPKKVLEDFRGKSGAGDQLRADLSSPGRLGPDEGMPSHFSLVLGPRSVVYMPFGWCRGWIVGCDERHGRVHVRERAGGRRQWSADATIGKRLEESGRSHLGCTAITSANRMRPRREACRAASEID